MTDLKGVSFRDFLTKHVQKVGNIKLSPDVMERFRIDPDNSASYIATYLNLYDLCSVLKLSGIDDHYTIANILTELLSLSIEIKDRRQTKPPMMKEVYEAMDIADYVLLRERSVMSFEAFSKKYKFSSAYREDTYRIMLMNLNMNKLVEMGCLCTRVLQVGEYFVYVYKKK